MAVDPNDVMLMARTMWGENNNATPEEYAAIAHVMRNRMLAGGYSGGASPRLGSGTMASVVLAPHQFQAWDDPRAKNYPMNAPMRSPAFQAAYHIAANVLSGQGEDPTHGAVYYYNPKAPGQKTPDWAKGREGQQIGAHKFYGPLTAVKDEHPDLMEGAPDEPKQAPTETAGIGDSVVSGGDKHADLMEGAPPPSPSKPESVSSVTGEKGDFSGMFGELGPQIRAHPYAAGALTALGAVPIIMGGGAVAAGLGSLIRAYPLAAQLLAASGAGAATQAGLPGQAVHSLFHLLHMAGD